MQHESTTKKSNPIVLITLVFTLAIFIIGTFFFFKIDRENKSLRASLLKNGVRTKGYIVKKIPQSNRRMTSSDFKWQYTTNYTIIFRYEHSSKPMNQNAITLESYLNTAEEVSTTPKISTLGEMTAEATITLEQYEQQSIGQSIDIIYLLNQPLSVKVLTPEGKIQVPFLSIFGYLCLLLALVSTLLLLFYYKTGRTF